MVARDYKRMRARKEPFSGWTGLVLGLAIGFGAGLALYFFDPRVPAAPAAGAAATGQPAAGGAPGPEESDRYDFYEMLPNFEVVVPEREAAVQRHAPAAAVEKSGAYVLQAGSYRKVEEADRVRAQLALQGIEARVQRVSIDADTWHRVRIGPISDLSELNRVRDRLREADMDVLVIRVGD
jgi:cell division protein FtsN